MSAFGGKAETVEETPENTVFYDGNCFPKSGWEAHGKHLHFFIGTMSDANRIARGGLVMLA